MTNEVSRLFVGGEEAFKVIIENIQEAKSSIYINMFIWRDDHIGNRVAEAVLDAANRGVKIHISKDRLGMLFEYSEEHKASFFHHRLFTRWYLQSIILDFMYPMEGKGKRHEKEINPLYFQMLRHKNIVLDIQRVKMDHSKYFIFDNEILILGGMNIEDKEVFTDVSGRTYFDYMVEFRHPLVVDVFKKRTFGCLSYDMSRPVEYMFNHVYKGRKTYRVCGQILDFLDGAKESVTIVMAYIGDKRIQDKLVEIMKRGVKVTLVLPEQANLQQDLNMKNLKELMEVANGLCVYLSPKMIHAKLILVDQVIVSFGSTNLNKQAMDVLLELNVVLDCDSYFGEDIKTKLLESIENLIDEATKIEDISLIHFNKWKALCEGLVQ